MDSRLIEQPTAGFSPQLSQGDRTPITSVGSGANQLLSPTFTEASTNSPFSTAGPLLGGLMGAILANREAVAALEAERARTAAGRTSGTTTGGASGGSGGLTAAAMKAVKDALMVNKKPATSGGSGGGSGGSTGSSAGMGNPDTIYYATPEELAESGYIGTHSGTPISPLPASPEELAAETKLGLYTGTHGIDAPPTSFSPYTQTGEQIIKDTMPDYNSGIYADAAGNIWSNGRLVYDADTGDYSSGGNWFNKSGTKYSLGLDEDKSYFPEFGSNYDFQTPAADTGLSTSFGRDNYDFSMPSSSVVDDFVNRWNTPEPSSSSLFGGVDLFNAPSFDFGSGFGSGSYDFGFKDGGNVTMMKKGGLAHFVDGGTVQVYPTLTGGWKDAQGNPTDSMGNPINASTSAFVPPTNMFANVTSAAMDAAAPASSPTIDPSLLDSLASFLPSTIMDYIRSATSNAGGTLLGAGAGAALGELLSNMTQNTGGVNKGVDMTKVGVIAPHTTDFGMGPARYVGYDQYGSPSGPDVYANTNLYADLGTPMNKPMGGLSSVQQKADGGAVHFTYGNPVDPMQIMGGDQGMRDGGTPEALGHPEMAAGRRDFRQGSYVHGPGDGQSDDIPAMLADGEYVFDADTVAALGNGSSKAGAKALDKMRESIRAHKRSAPINKIPPPAKSPLAYLKGMK
jgi:hypothetical protein